MSEEIEVWSTEQVSIIKYMDREKTFDREITVEDVKEFARSRGLKKFVVKDEQGNTLSPSDFPRVGTIVIEEYNEPKSF